MAEPNARPLSYNQHIAVGTRVYIVGNHPWADCSGVVVAYEHNLELERFGARVHLDNENIDVMVWYRSQLHVY